MISRFASILFYYKDNFLTMNRYFELLKTTNSHLNGNKEQRDSEQHMSCNDRTYTTRLSWKRQGDHSNHFTIRAVKALQVY